MSRRTRHGARRHLRSARRQGVVDRWRVHVHVDGEDLERVDVHLLGRQGGPWRPVWNALGVQRVLGVERVLAHAAYDGDAPVEDLRWREEGQAGRRQVHGVEGPAERLQLAARERADTANPAEGVRQVRLRVAGGVPRYSVTPAPSSRRKRLAPLANANQTRTFAQYEQLQRLEPSARSRSASKRITPQWQLPV